MAELQVGIRADVRDARRVVKSLDQIKRAAGQSSATLNNAARSAKTASSGYQIASGSALKLAGATDLTAAANASLANSLRATTATATKAAQAETAAAAATNRLGVAARAAQAAQTGALRATNALTVAMARLRATMAGMFAGPTAGLKRFGAQMRTAGATVVGFSAGAAGLGAALAIGIGTGIKSAVDFEKTLSRITGLVGIAADEVKAFEKPLLDISKATTKGPNELADALFFITSAGARGKDALDILEASAKAAAAGLGETKQVADAVTSAVNAYGSEALSASMATDILTKTVREGKAEADSIASSLGRVLPIAANLGVGMDQVGATIAALTRQGLDANEATTSLRASLATLIKPTSEAEETLARLSQQNLGTTLTFGDLREMLASGDKNILEVFELMNKAVGGSGDALVKLVPNIRANAGVFSLLGKNLDENRKIFDSLADSAGTTDDAFEAYKNTTSFELNEALNVLKISLQEIGDKLLPAAAKAFVWLAEAVEKTVDGMTGLGEAIARAIGGADEPVERLEDNLRDVEDALQAYQRAVVGDITGIGEDGNLIWEERTGLINDARRSLIDFFQANQIDTDLGTIDLSGDFDEDRATLEAWRDKLNEAIADAKKMNETLEETDDILEEIVVTATKRKITPIDEDLLMKGQKALKGLNTDVDVLEQSLIDLATKGAAGLGLAEDAQTANEIFKQLQGTVEGLSREDIENLLAQKRRLEDAVGRVTAAIQLQQQAFDFIADVEMDVANLAAQFEAVQAGGSLIEVQTAQEAARIMRDLGDQTSYTQEEIHNLLLEQQAWNAALAAMDPTGLKDVEAFIGVLKAEQATLDSSSERFQQLQKGIDALGTSAIDATLSDLGIGELVDFTSLEQQFQDGYDRIKAAFDLAGIVDPESDPRFQAAIDKLQEKIYGIGDIMKEFGKAAAQNLQSSFSDFLFDPFSEGLDGMARKFGETLRRLAADILANQILTSFFKSLAGAGGGIGSFANAALGALGGTRAEGGPVQPGKSYLVGEKGPEVITPRESGSVIPNEMLQPQTAAPNVNVAPAPVIVLDDPAKIGRALSTDQNTQRALVDAIATKKGAINQALS